MKTSLCVILFVAACTSSSNNNNNPVCGDGVLDTGEACDDGNTTNGDGCSSTCTIEVPVVCGDGTIAGSEQCDDGNTTSGDGCSATCDSEYKTTANWTIKMFGTTQALPCPNGFDTAAVYSQLLDASGNPSGNPVIDLFSCSDGTGTTGFLPQGVYQTWIAITTSGGSSTYAQTVDADVDLRTADATYSADIVKDGGYFSWSWILQGETSQNMLTCAQVSGIQGVELTVTVTNSSTAYNDMFTCDDGRGVTAVIPEGSYTVSADAFSSGGSIGTAPTLNNRLVAGPNKITDLGTITIPITGQ